MQEITFTELLSMNLNKSKISNDKQKQKTPQQKKKSITRIDRKRPIDKNNNSICIDTKPKYKRSKFSPQRERELRQDIEKRFNDIADRIVASRYECEHCGEVCYNKMVHMKERHTDKSTDCPHCDQLIAMSDWSKHFRQCQPDLFTYVCNWCQSEFTDFSAGCLCCSKQHKPIENESDQLNASTKILDEFLENESIASNDFNKFEEALDKTDLRKVLNNKDEEFLRIVFDPIKTKDADLEEPEPENKLKAKLLDIVQNSLENFKPAPVKENEELISLAKKRRQNIEKEKRAKEKELMELERKKKELTFSKLMAMEEKEEFQVERKLAEYMNDLECPSTVVTDITYREIEELLIEEKKQISEKELNEILKIYNQRDYKAHETVKVNDFEMKKCLEDTSVPAVYDCHCCDQFTTTVFSQYYDHLRNHNNEIVRRKPHAAREKCVVCGVIVPSEVLSDHIRLHKVHICCYICKTFVNEDEYASHVMSHKDHYRCNICGEIYEKIHAIRMHISHHRKGQTYSCEHCNLKFCSLQKIVMHISHVHKMIDTTFAECIYCFELTDEIKNHVFSTDACKFKCKMCPKIYTNKKDFISHFQSHVSGMKFKPETNPKFSLSCSVCGFMTKNAQIVEDHLLCHRIDSLYSQHVVRKPRIQCEICKTIMLKSYIDHHMKKHDYYDRCPTCAKFVLKNNLQDHISAHELEFKCEICEERFPTEKNLVDHQFAHSRLVQRPCSQCHLIFNSEVNRVKHISAVHNNIDSEQIECIFCKEIFFYTALPNPKTYVPPLEDIGFHLLQLPYCLRRCKLCNEKFQTPELYKSHMLTDHGSLLNISDLD